MTAVPILSVRREWWCPHCTQMSVTERADMHVEFHHCRGMAGLWAPMFQRGERGHLEPVERQDYVGKDKVTTDARGRAYQAIDKVDAFGNQTGLFVLAPSGQVRVHLDAVEDLCPQPVRRRGRDTMRRYLSAALLTGARRMMRRPRLRPQ